MPSIIISGFNIHPPPGLTPGGKLHQFQARTVERLSAMTQDFMDEAVADMRNQMAQAYHSDSATGRAASSLRAVVKGDRQRGVSGQILIGSFREVGYLTSLGGGRFVGTSKYPIYPRSPKGRISFVGPRGRFVGQRGAPVLHSGFPAGDVLTAAAATWGDAFQRTALATVSRGLTELTSGSAARANTPPVSRKFKR